MDLAGNNTHDAQPLPDGWVWTTLGETCLKPQYGWTTSAAPDGTLRLLRTTDITSGNVEWETVPFCKADPPEKKKFLLEDGDIVVSRAGSVGFSHLVRNPKDAVFASYLIRFKPLIEQRYVAFFLKSPSYWEAISEKSIGIAIPNVNATKLKAIQIPLTPLPEQHRIVAEIETQFTRLDAAVAALERAQANLQRYKASVLKAACESRLLPPEELKAIRESPDYEPADVLLQRILAERRQRWEEEQWQNEIEKAKKKAAQAKRKAAGLSARISDLTDDEWQDLSEEVYADHLPQNDHWKHKYKEPAQPDLENLTELPEGWMWASVEQICTHIVDCLHSTPKFQDTGLVCVDTNSIRPGKIVLDNVRYVDKATFIERNRRMKPKEDDVLFSREGALLGIAVRVPPNLDFCLGQRMMVFRLGENASAKYYELVLNSLVFRSQYIKQITGTASPHLNIWDIRILGIPLPPFAEQHRIVEEVERHLSVIAVLEASVEANLRRAERLRQSILKRAFEGRLVPQDPNDEPASVLLARIQAQREAEGKSKKKGKKTSRRKKGQPRQLELL